MHTVGDATSSVPAFLGKLWKLVEDPSTNHLISWNAVRASICNHSLPSDFVGYQDDMPFIHVINNFKFSKLKLIFLLIVVFGSLVEWCEFYHQGSGTICQRTASALL